MVTPQYLFRTVGASDSGEHDSYSIIIGNDLELHVAGYSHTGMERKHNEDNYLLQDGLLVVCDGMGGHNAGEVASEIACTIFGKNHSKPHTTLEKNLTTLAEEAHKAIRDAVDKDPSKSNMGTTLVAARFDDGKISFTNVGDSRLYHYSLHDYTLAQLTMDHSLVQDLFEAGKIKRDDMKAHKLRNVLTLSLGYEQTLDTEKIREYTLACSVGDVYLLCSDGLNVLDDDAIKKVMHETYAAHPDNDLAVAQALVAAANVAGGPDNITVVLARVASFSIDKIVQDGLNAVASGDNETLYKITRRYSEKLRELGSSKADFLLATASDKGKMHRQAIDLYESVLKTTPVTERVFSDGSYFRQTIERLVALYNEVYGNLNLHFQTHFDKLYTLRSLEDIDATPTQESIDAALIRRIAGLGKELIENYTATTRTSPAASDLEKIARDMRAQTIPDVRDALVHVYTALTGCARSATNTADALHFIDCLQAIDPSVSIPEHFIHEEIPLENYQQALARFRIGESPEVVLDVLQRFSVDEYNGGAGAVLFLKAQCHQRQGNITEYRAALERAVRADCSDITYSVEQQDVFVAYAQQLYLDRNFGRLHELFSQGKDFSALMDYKIKVIGRVYQKCIEATDKNDLKKSREYARQVITVEAGSIDAVTLQHEKSLKAAFRIAATYQQEQRHREARDAYRQFLKLPQLQDARYSHAEAWYRIAQTYEKDRRFPEAREWYRKILALTPEQKNARDGLYRCRK
jgi:protein phosphatase